MQGKARPAGQQRVVTRFLQRWHAVQGERFAPGVGSDGDAVGNGSRLQVIEAGAGFQVQVGELRVGDQQAAAFQHPYDAAGEGIEQVIEFLTGGPAGAVKDGPLAAKSIGAVQEQHVQVDVEVERRAETLDQGDRRSARSPARIAGNTQQRWHRAPSVPADAGGRQARRRSETEQARDMNGWLNSVMLR